MKQSTNEVYIEGFLSEATIVTGTSKGRNWVRGEVKIQVDQKINDEIVTSIIPIRMFSMETSIDKATGQTKPNRNYGTICGIKDNFVSAASAGDPALADGIRISKGSLNENLFTPKGSDKEVSSIEVQSNFINKIPRASVVPSTRFSVDIAINSIKDEMKGGELTGAIIIKGGIVQYADVLDLIDFKVINAAAQNHIRLNYKTGDTVNLRGYLLFASKTDFVEEEAGFGEAVSIPKTTTIKDLIVTTGSIAPFDVERAFKREELNVALDARLARITESKAEAMIPKAQPAAEKPATGTKTNNGF